MDQKTNGGGEYTNENAREERRNKQVKVARRRIVTVKMTKQEKRTKLYKNKQKSRGGLNQG